MHHIALRDAGVALKLDAEAAPHATRTTVASGEIGAAYFRRDIGRRTSDSCPGWPIASFGCVVEFGRDRCIADSLTGDVPPTDPSWRAEKAERSVGMHLGQANGFRLRGMVVWGKYSSLRKKPTPSRASR